MEETLKLKSFKKILKPLKLLAIRWAQIKRVGRKGNDPSNLRWGACQNISESRQSIEIAYPLGCAANPFVEISAFSDTQPIQK